MTPSAEPSAAARQGPELEGRAPDFLIVGHEKCGTTALYRLLVQHPGVFMPELKEPRFFLAEHPAAAGGGAAGRGVRPRSLEQYLALFAPADPGQLAGEASPQYIRTREAAQRIAAVAPHARIIVLLREPVSFLRTFHLNNVRELIEDQRELRRALELEADRREGRRLPPGCRAPGRLMYGELVRYVEQLRRFEEHFGRDRMLVLIYEDFQRDNQAELASVLRFLGLDEEFRPQTSYVKRERKGVRLARLHRAAKALQLAQRKPQEAGRFWRAVDRATPGWLRSGGVEELARRAVFSVPAPPDEALTAELRRRFAPEVRALGEYLGRDMAAEWGYDRID